MDIGRITSEIEGIANEAYQRGWNDAMKAIASAVAEIGGQNGVHSLATNGTLSRLSKGSLPSGSMMDFMYSYIKQNPGKPGIDVIIGTVKLGAAAGVELNVRSGRTALGRLRKDKKLIEKREEGWYARE
jgi:hypothetical protein